MCCGKTLLNMSEKTLVDACSRPATVLDRVILSALMTHKPQEQLRAEVTRESIGTIIPPSGEALPHDAKAKKVESYNADRAFVVERLAQAFAGCERNFLQVQSTVEKAWPPVSSRGLDALRSLARLPCVTQEQVRNCLVDESFGFENVCTEKKTAGTDRVVACLFYTQIGGKPPASIPGQCILDVLNALRSGEVDDESLAEDFAAHQIDSRRAVSSFLFFIYLFVALAAIVVNLRVYEGYVLGSATAPTSNWLNYCEGGPTGSCHFDIRTFGGISNREDALRFLRVELPAALWANANGGRASDSPFGLAWFIGALSLRVSPTVDEVVPYSCASLNLTQTYSLAVTSQRYTCGAYSYITVPFSSTLDEANAALKNFTIGSPYQDVSVVAEYSLFLPSDGYTVLHEAALTFLKNGGVIPRARQYVSSPAMTDSINIAFILHFVFAFVEDILLIISKVRRLPTNVSLLAMVPKIVAFVAICYSKAYVSMQNTVPDWIQSTHVAPNIDVRVYSDQLAQYAFGVWILAMICNACAYLRNFESVDLVVKLVAKAISPVVSVTLVFGFGFVTLILIAMFIFGVNQLEFSTFVFAVRSTFPFLFNAGDPTVFTEEYTGLGYYYFAVFSIYISFLVMNVFVGIIMAPLGALSSSTAVYVSALQRHVTRQKDVMSHHRSVIRMSFKLLPLLNLGHDALPYPDFNWSVVYRLLYLRTNTEDRVKAARRLYEMLDAGKRDEWRDHSRIFRGMEKKRASFSISEASFELCTIVIAYESRFNVVRDARLLRLLSFHDTLTQQQNQTFAAADEEEEADEEQTESQAAHESESVAALESELSPMEMDNAMSMRTLVSKTIHTTSETNVSYGFVTHVHDRLFGGGISTAPATTFIIFLLEIGLILGYYLYIFVVVTSAAHETAFFTADLHSGLRDAEFLQNCNEVNCTAATTNPATFLTNSQLSDLQAFLNRSLKGSLFPGEDDISYDPTSSILISNVYTTPVRWSPVPRLGRLWIRQLRGAVTKCMPFPSSSPNTTENAARLQLINSMSCYKEDEWERANITKPIDSPLDDSAYVFQGDYCPNEDSTWPIKGYQYSFPCAGYTANITSDAQLEYAASTWIVDPSVKFVAVGMSFFHWTGNDSAPLNASYNMYSQFGMGGAQGEFWVSVTQRNSPIMADISRVSFIFLTCNFALLFLVLTVQIIVRFTHTAPLRFSIYREVDHMFPFMTTWMFALCCIVFLTQKPSKKWANVVASCLVALYFNIKMITMIVLPLAGVLSRRGTTIPRMILLVCQRSFIVAPFLGIFWVAFALAGNVMWGANVQGYATISKSFFTVSRGFLNAWDFASIEPVFPGLAMSVTAVFFLAVLVVLLPTLLSLIVQSAEDANDELAITDAVCGLAEATNSSVMFGPLARVLLSVWCLAKSSARRDVDAGEVADIAVTQIAFTKVGRALTTPVLKMWLRILGRSSVTLEDDAQDFEPIGNGQVQQHGCDASGRRGGAGSERLYFDESWRMPTAIECLLPYIGPIQIGQLREMLHYDDLRLSMKYSAVAFLLMEYNRFKRRSEDIAKDDKLKEKQQSAVYAALNVGQRQMNGETIAEKIAGAMRIYSPAEARPLREDED